jgi:hypothetical protein
MARRLLKRAALVAVLRSPLAHFLIISHPNSITAYPFVPQVRSNTTTKTSHHLFHFCQDVGPAALSFWGAMKAKFGRLLDPSLTQMYLKAYVSLVRCLSLAHQHLPLSFTSSTSLDSSPHLRAFARSHYF